jgi:FkbM family methyltransferase
MMPERLAIAIELARKGHWKLFAAKTLRTLGLRAALDRLTCEIVLPGEPAIRPLRVHLELGDVISDDICRYGEWEPVLSRRILSHARSGGVLVDVGANLGYFSLLWAAANESNQAHALEASPRIFRKLVRNVRLNRLESRIRSYEMALSDREGVSAFEPGPEEQTGWGGLVDTRTAGVIDVETTRLDVLFADLRRIDVLKIDVEGADTRVLLGAERLLCERRIGAVFFEQIIDRMADLGIAPGDAMTFLARCGYSVRRIIDPRYEGDGRITEWEALPR